MANTGYDDSKELLKMAKGLRSGMYSSVEQAAKAVLEDPRQSNVDRLRRKFRDQNWRNRFATVDTPTFRDCLTIIRRRMGTPKATVRRFFARDVRADYPFIPTMSLLSALVVLLTVDKIVSTLITDRAISMGLVLSLLVICAMSAIIQTLCVLSLDRFEGYPSLDASQPWPSSRSVPSDTHMPSKDSIIV